MAVRKACLYNAAFSVRRHRERRQVAGASSHQPAPLPQIPLDDPRVPALTISAAPISAAKTAGTVETFSSDR